MSNMVKLTYVTYNNNNLKRYNICTCWNIIYNNTVWPQETTSLTIFLSKDGASNYPWTLNNDYYNNVKS